MVFTPSATSSFSAGAVFWGMVWASVAKLDELARFMGFKHAKPRQKVLGWVNSHKVVTLLGTESFNYAVHGISSTLGVTFALGGTLVNLLFVSVVTPIWCRLGRLETH